MGFSAAQYLRMLLSLLPGGLAWPRESDTTAYNVADAMAQELQRIDSRVQDLLRQSDPRTTTELLSDWERVVGIPDECSGVSTSLQARRNEVVARLTGGGSLSRQFFIDFAAYLGFEIEIYEYRPFRAGLSCAGDPLSNGDWIFVWEVRAPEDTVLHFSAGQNSAGDPLAEWGNDVLECAIRKRAPAGTKVLFVYGG